MNRLSEVEPLMRGAILIFHRSLGGQHPNTQVVRQNYKSILFALGMSEEDADAKIQARLQG